MSLVYAEDFAVPLIREHVTPVFVDHHQPNSRFTSDAAQHRLAFRQTQLRFAQICDVGIGAEPTNNFSGVIADRKGARKEPAILSVTAAQRKSVFPVLPMFER